MATTAAVPAVSMETQVGAAPSAPSVEKAVVHQMYAKPAQPWPIVRSSQVAAVVQVTMASGQVVRSPDRVAMAAQVEAQLAPPVATAWVRPATA